MNEIKNSSDIIIFGAYGDLSFRKLIPALYHLFNDDYLDADSKTYQYKVELMNFDELAP